MSAEIYTHRFDNGLWLLAEPVAGAESLAMTLRVPGGIAAEPPTRLGLTGVLAEMLCRGAGSRDARAHSEALDQLGVQRGTSTETFYMRLGAIMIGHQLSDALPLLLDMIREPQLPAGALEPCRDLALQAIEALEDEPQSKVFEVLRARHLPQPLGRSTLGNKADLEALTLADVQAHWQRTFVPEGAVLAFAGKFDWAALKDQVAAQVSDWRGTCTLPSLGAEGPGGYCHEAAESTQVHIGLAYHSLVETDPRSILQKVAVAVLSGGMSGRLFTEVREKRGLCYSVGARYSGDQHRGGVWCYAGTTTPRAQETLEVLVAELRRLAQGISASEFDRAVVGMKSGLVMQGESTSSRANALASDQLVYGHPRPLAELSAQVDSVTLPALMDYVQANPPGSLSVVTIGPQSLNPPV